MRTRLRNQTITRNDQSDREKGATVKDTGGRQKLERAVEMTSSRGAGCEAGARQKREDRKIFSHGEDPIGGGALPPLKISMPPIEELRESGYNRGKLMTGKKGWGGLVGCVFVYSVVVGAGSCGGRGERWKKKHLRGNGWTEKERNGSRKDSGRWIWFDY